MDQNFQLMTMIMIALQNVVLVPHHMEEDGGFTGKISPLNIQVLDLAINSKHNFSNCIEIDCISFQQDLHRVKEHASGVPNTFCMKY